MGYYKSLLAANGQLKTSLQINLPQLGQNHLAAERVLFRCVVFLVVYLLPLKVAQYYDLTLCKTLLQLCKSKPQNAKMSDFKFDQFKISILSFLIVSCQIVVLALVASELFSSSSDLMQGGGGQLESIFTGYVPLASQNPYPLYSIL